MNNLLNIWCSEWEMKPVLSKERSKSHAQCSHTHSFNEWQWNWAIWKWDYLFWPNIKVSSLIWVLDISYEGAYTFFVMHSIVSSRVNNWISLLACKFVDAGFCFSQWRCAPISVCKFKRSREMVKSVKHCLNRRPIVKNYTRI